jgi:hypothetical protein
MGVIVLISSRAHLLPSLRTGKFTVECPCPDAFRFSIEEKSNVELWESGVQPSGKVSRKCLEICIVMLKSCRVFVFPLQ